MERTSEDFLAIPLADPSLLVLDEPTNGLDPAGILEMRAPIRSLTDDGFTVLISSRLQIESDQIGDHLVIIRSEQLVDQGGVQQSRESQSLELVALPELQEQTSILLDWSTRRNDRPVPTRTSGPSWSRPQDGETVGCTHSLRSA
jgi:ABC-type multidrug transport system ATPase subunit